MSSEKSPRLDKWGKTAQAWALHQKGLDNPTIAARLGVPTRSVNTMICKARKRHLLNRPYSRGRSY